MSQLVAPPGALAHPSRGPPPDGPVDGYHGTVPQ